jgi:hypothetical protein
MPSSRTIRKDNFSVNLLPIEVVKGGVNQTQGIERLISASEIYSAQASLITSGHEEEQPVYMVGDMHGNALKLLAVLGLTGAVRLQPDSFKAWAELYESVPPATDYFGSISRNNPEKLNEAKELYNRIVKRPENFQDKIKIIIDKLSWNPDFKGQIVLLGDVLHDRGHSDFMTVLLMERMHVKNIRFSYCLGNHDQGVLLRYIWTAKGMAYGTEQYAGEVLDREFFQGLMSGGEKPEDAQSYDFRALNTKQQKLFIKAYETVLRHLKIYEHVSLGDQIVVGSHCIFQPRLLNRLSQTLKIILQMKNTQEERSASVELIDDINRMLQKAISSKKTWGLLAGALIDYKNDLYKAISTRKSSVAGEYGSVEALNAEFSTGDYSMFYSVYGHDLDGSVSQLGKINPAAIKKDPSKAGDISLCLDTMIGRPKLSEWNTAASSWASRKSKTAPRAPYPEDLKGFYQGELLICSITPEIKDPEQKLIQTQRAVINGIYAYENWFKSLGVSERKPAHEQERQIAHIMLADTMSAETPSAVRLVLQDFAKDLYGAKLASHAVLLDHRNNLLSYLLDSINAAYPPLSLAVKLGSAEAGSHSFTVDYPEETGRASENTRLSKIKSEAFQKMKSIGVKAQSERSGIDAAKIKENNLSRNKPQSTGARRVVDFFKSGK